MTAAANGKPDVALLLADVDGTLVTPEKELTERAIAAVRRLKEAGIAFAVTSGRPPRGMAMLVEPLQIELPIAAFNGGLYARPDMSVIEERSIASDLVAPAIELLTARGLDVWLYRDAEWLVRDAGAPHIRKEADTVRFEPTVVESFDGITEGVAKIVGVSDDHAQVQQAEADARGRLGDRVSASRSQPYYLDVTHPDANKGAVARWLSRKYEIPPSRIATIGDMPNDVLMFAHSGLSIAMGNADREVQRAARRVTASNAEEGFALAVEKFVLGER
ncbi:MAG TPA: Cof-type HAD-IIB family hydrolase [Solirubrobacteraceae bacterium]